MILHARPSRNSKFMTIVNLLVYTHTIQQQANVIFVDCKLQTLHLCASSGLPFIRLLLPIMETNVSANKYLNVGRPADQDDGSATARTICFPSEEACNSSPSYFDWKEVYPQLHVLIDNYDTIMEEMMDISTVSTHSHSPFALYRH